MWLRVRNAEDFPVNYRLESFLFWQSYRFRKFLSRGEGRRGRGTGQGHDQMNYQRGLFLIFILRSLAKGVRVQRGSGSPYVCPGFDASGEVSN